MKPKRTIEKRYLKITSAATANLSDALFPRYIRYISGIAKCTVLHPFIVGFRLSAFLGTGRLLVYRTVNYF